MPIRSSDSLRHWPARFGASAALAVALATCATPRGPVALAPSPGAKEPEVRIGIVAGGASAAIGAQGDAVATLRGEVTFRLIPFQQINVQAEGLAVLVNGGPAPGRYENLSFVSLAPDRFIMINGKPYRGVVDVYVRNAALYVVNRLGIDAYLQGVISAEMGKRAANEIAALQAQAVVSRTYTLANRNRYSAQGFDLAADISDQAYGGVGSETDQGNEAIRVTRGVLLTYRGHPIRAFFHSTCGYATAAPEEAFRQISAQPYLRSVSDRNPRGGYYCDISPRFRWQVEWDADSLAHILRRTAPIQAGLDRSKIDHIQDMRVTRKGPSGRATEVQVSTNVGDLFITAPDIRTVLRTPAGDVLGSSAFQLRTRREGDRLLISAAGAGWGHGVGLCQWGSVGRARTGQDYRTIVSAYFPGAELSRWY